MSEKVKVQKADKLLIVENLDGAPFVVGVHMPDKSTIPLVAGFPVMGNMTIGEATNRLLNVTEALMVGQGQTFNPANTKVVEFVRSVQK